MGLLLGVTRHKHTCTQAHMRKHVYTGRIQCGHKCNLHSVGAWFHDFLLFGGHACTQGHKAWATPRAAKLSLQRHDVPLAQRPASQRPSPAGPSDAASGSIWQPSSGASSHHLRHLALLVHCLRTPMQWFTAAKLGVRRSSTVRIVCRTQVVLRHRLSSDLLAELADKVGARAQVAHLRHLCVCTCVAEAGTPSLQRGR